MINVVKPCFVDFVVIAARHITRIAFIALTPPAQSKVLHADLTFRLSSSLYVSYNSHRYR